MTQNGRLFFSLSGILNPDSPYPISLFYQLQDQQPIGQTDLIRRSPFFFQTANMFTVRKTRLQAHNISEHSNELGVRRIAGPPSHYSLNFAIRRYL
ncbi:MAG: hypothetical protein EA360_10435 [Balneolaceae bacterium]|nr:MAG: hypothetical protein EA360_10435 [Balneolaceae bacterium]